MSDKSRSYTDAELIAIAEDDISYLAKGHRPGSAADAIGIARDYAEVLRRFKAYARPDNVHRKR